MASRHVCQAGHRRIDQAYRRRAGKRLEFAGLDGALPIGRYWRAADEVRPSRLLSGRLAGFATTSWLS